MNSPKNINATLSAGAVATAPPPRAASKSEAAYLKEQAANAKVAFTQTLGEVFTGLGAGVSPAKWTQAHPWMMLASATAIGFSTACVAVPSKEQAALNRLKKLEEMLQDPPPERHHESNGKKTEKKTLMQVLIAELIRAGSGSGILAAFLKASTVPPAAPGVDPSGDSGTGSSQATSS